MVTNLTAELTHLVSLCLDTVVTGTVDQQSDRISREAIYHALCRNTGTHSPSSETGF